MTSPYLSEAQAAFLRSPLLDKYTVLSKQYLNLVSTTCSADYATSCQNINSSPYSSEELSMNPIPPGFLNDMSVRGRDAGFLSRFHGHDDHHHHHRRLQGPPPRPGPPQGPRGPGPHNETEFRMHERDHHMGPPGNQPLGPDPLAGLRLFPLGYGAQGDACLLNSFPDLSGKCQQSLMTLQDLRLSYWRDTAAGAVGGAMPPPHHGPGVLGIFLIIALVGSFVFCCFKKFGKRRAVDHHVAVHDLILAINANPVLKDTVESTTGLQVPPPHPVGPSRFFEFLRGNPYLANTYRQGTPVFQAPSAPPAHYERAPTFDDHVDDDLSGANGNRRVVVV